jgi:hypothetical protein
MTIDRAFALVDRTKAPWRTAEKKFAELSILLPAISVAVPSSSFFKTIARVDGLYARRWSCLSTRDPQ